MARLRQSIASPSTAAAAAASSSSSSRRTPRGIRESSKDLNARPETRPGSAAPQSSYASQLSSPDEEEASDKENTSSRRVRMSDKSREDASGRSSKRQRTASPDGHRDNATHGGSRTPRFTYDPDQSMAERQRIRRSMRDLNAEAVNMRSEWIKPNNDGLERALKRSDAIYSDVKQTSDATIDSRFLVTASDMMYKKTTTMVMGDSSASIDLDEFVGKCITFMRRGDEQERAASTASRVQVDDEGEEEEEDDDTQSGDALNWKYLGLHACWPTNSRPPLPNFLLGPLSVQKRARKAAQRRANQRSNAEVTRPDEIQEGDLQKSDTADLTRMCRKIHLQLKNSIEACERKLEEEDMKAGGLTEEQIEEVAATFGIDDSGGLSLFKFALNPHSFGQSVENLFYLSFLIKDGWVGVASDKYGVPSITNAKQDEEEDPRDDQNRRRHQAVLSLDFETWQGLCDEFQIEESMVPHRDQGQTAVGQRGWY